MRRIPVTLARLPASICMEYYCYDPAAGWSEITADDYVFLTIDTVEHPDIYDGWRIAVVTIDMDGAGEFTAANLVARPFRWPWQ